jgi:hypothetical protein
MNPTISALEKLRKISSSSLFRMLIELRRTNQSQNNDHQPCWLSLLLAKPQIKQLAQNRPQNKLKMSKLASKKQFM